MIERALGRNGGAPALEFRVADIGTGPVTEPFDHIILDYLTGYLPDIQAALKSLHAAAHPRTRLHLTTINTLWLFPLRLAAGSGLVSRQPAKQLALARRSVSTCSNWPDGRASRLSTFSSFRSRFPWCRPFANRLLVKLPGIRHLGATVAITARPAGPAPVLAGGVGCSVVVPARNTKPATSGPPSKGSPCSAGARR